MPGRKNMLVPTLIMALIAILLFALAAYRDQGEQCRGLQSAWQMLVEILPLMILAFIVAGLVQELLPSELIARWVGKESGWRGIFIGAIAGGLAPGGPYVSLPIVAGLLKSGAGIGTMVAFLTGWSLWAIGRLPMEVGILGWKFTVIRIVSTLIFPPLAGYLAHLLFANAKL
jgi:uncharacterized membrane protein YraQ (UPF0718 family)